MEKKKMRVEKWKPFHKKKGKNRSFQLARATTASTMDTFDDFALKNKTV